MFYFNLGLMNYKDWRVSHALSHHMYTNSFVDMELTGMEPILTYTIFPKHQIKKYVQWIYGPIIHSLFFVTDFLKR